MSRAATPDDVPPEVLLPRGERAKDMEARLRGMRYRVAVARFGHAALLVAPWLLCVVLAGILAAVLHAQITRPAPAPEVHIAVVGQNGRPEYAGLRENLPDDRRAIVAANSFEWQLFWREEYIWEEQQRNFDAVRATAAPDARRDYERRITDKADPRNPARIYGAGPDAAKARVVAHVVQHDKATPYAVAYTYVLAVQIKGQAECRIRKVARATFVDAREQMPAAVQARYSPSGYAFTSFVADADPGQTLPAHCLRYVQ